MQYFAASGSIQLIWAETPVEDGIWKETKFLTRCWGADPILCDWLLEAQLGGNWGLNDSLPIIGAR